MAESLRVRATLARILSSLACGRFDLHQDAHAPYASGQKAPRVGKADRLRKDDALVSTEADGARQQGPVDRAANDRAEALGGAEEVDVLGDEGRIRHAVQPLLLLGRIGRAR